MPKPTMKDALKAIYAHLEHGDNCKAIILALAKAGLQVKDNDLEAGIKVPVRFFIYDDESMDESDNIIECNEQTFLDCNYPIEYERHTVYSNGVSQICLTKQPKS